MAMTRASGSAIARAYAKQKCYRCGLECSSSARCLIVWSIFRSIRKWTGSRAGNSSSNQDGRALARTRTRSRQPISVGSSTKAQVQSSTAREPSVAAAAVMRSMR